MRRVGETIFRVYVHATINGQPARLVLDPVPGVMLDRDFVRRSGLRHLTWQDEGAPAPILSPPIAIHALPPEFPQEAIFGSRALSAFRVTLDQKQRMRLLREGPKELEVPRPAARPQ